MDIGVISEITSGVMESEDFVGILVLLAMIVFVVVCVVVARKKAAQRQQYTSSETQYYTADTEGVETHILRPSVAPTVVAAKPQSGISVTSVLSPARQSERPAAHSAFCAVGHEDAAQSNAVDFELGTDTNSIVQGLVWSEILEKPRALRQKA